MTDPRELAEDTLRTNFAGLSPSQIVALQQAQSLARALLAALDEREVLVAENLRLADAVGDSSVPDNALVPMVYLRRCEVALMEARKDARRLTEAIRSVPVALMEALAAHDALEAKRD